MDEQLKAFEALVAAHDLTYSYADDYKAYQRGYEQYVAIKRAAGRISREDAVRIWNAQVDKKIVEGHRGSFYWKQ